MAEHTLEAWYSNAFNFCHLNNFCTITEYENMIPFELDVYSLMLQEHAKKLSDAENQEASLEKARRELGY